MKGLLGDIIAEDTLRVNMIHSDPYHSEFGLSEEQWKNAVIVETILEAEFQEGKKRILYVTISSGEMWYEYEKRPLTPEEEIAQLKTKVEVQDQAIGELTMLISMPQ
ncbi:hypothetical protein V1503_24925 [Bacillus sp. SCS-151]|uniref:hypothetical protein n=1 Tax=Nanhaiella sioensis TaxID=3115293 RepID=UPI00397CF48E